MPSGMGSAKRLSPATQRTKSALQRMMAVAEPSADALEALAPLPEAEVPEVEPPDGIADGDDSRASSRTLPSWEGRSAGVERLPHELAEDVPASAAGSKSSRPIAAGSGHTMLACAVELATIAMSIASRQPASQASEWPPKMRRCLPDSIAMDRFALKSLCANTARWNSVYQRAFYRRHDGIASKFFENSGSKSRHGGPCCLEYSM